MIGVEAVLPSLHPQAGQIDCLWEETSTPPTIHDPPSPCPSTAAPGILPTHLVGRDEGALLSLRPSSMHV